MRKLIKLHKLFIGRCQTKLRIDNYETLWLSWLKGVVIGVIITTLLSGCYIYESSSTPYNYQQESSITYYQTHYAPTLDLYHWNDLPYWGYSDGWYYYYGYRHSYPWWYYYHYTPSYHYSLHTHVYCQVGLRNQVVRPNTHRRMDNKKYRSYNVKSVNQIGLVVKNNSNVPTKFQNNFPIRTKVIVTPNRNTKVKSNNTLINRSNEIYINRPNTKVKTNTRVKTNRTNTNRSNKSNNRRPR